MKNIFIISIVLISSVLNLSAQNEKIKWVSFEEVLELNKKAPKKIFIDVYTTWCGPCKMLEAHTFSDPSTIELINEHYYAVKFDAEYKDTIVFQNKDYVFVPTSRRGYHTLAAALCNGKLSYPTMLFLTIDPADENVTWINPISGFMKPDVLNPILSYIGEDHFKNGVSFEDYKAKLSVQNAAIIEK